MNRRDFLLLKAPATSQQPAMLSCETLYMRFLDARVQDRTDRLFELLRDDLSRTDSVKLNDVAWLSDETLKQQVDVLLDEFRGRGGRVEL